jgi:hypothetical protein
MQTTGTTKVRAQSISKAAPPAARFGLHVAQMCMVMCVSLVLLAGLVISVSAALGFSGDLRSEAPELSAMVVAVVLAVSMLGWMRWRGMQWRPTLEMAGTALAAGVVLVAGYWLGLVPGKELAMSVCGVACVAMIALMAVRFRTYSHSAHHTPR